MNLEMPLAVYAHQMIDYVKANSSSVPPGLNLHTCELFYTHLTFNETEVSALCSNESDFKNYTNLETMYKLININYYDN